MLSQFSSFFDRYAEELRGKVRRSLMRGREIWRLRLRGCGIVPSIFFFFWLVWAGDGSGVVDTELREWIMPPRFSTTKKDDEVVAAVLVMGTL